MAKKIKVDIDLVKRILTSEEALDLLETHMVKKKKRVHSFTDAGIAIMGCNIDLSVIKTRLKALKGDDIQLAGTNMRNVGHGVAYWEANQGWVFLATDKVKLEVILKVRKIK